jgi:hypothetical protein
MKKEIKGMEREREKKGGEKRECGMQFCALRFETF